MRGGKLCLGALAFSLLSGGTAFAGVINPSFEDPKTEPWKTIGAVKLHEIFQDTVLPSDGNQLIVAHTNRNGPKTVMMTDFGSNNVVVSLDLFQQNRRARRTGERGPFFLPTENTNKTAVANALTLSMFFGTDLYELTGGQTVYDGSGFSQTFTIDQTSILTFDWAIGHRLSEPTGNDIAFVVLDGEVYLLSYLYDVFFVKWAKNQFIVSDWSTFEGLPELAPGEHTIIFGVVNVGVDSGRTSLMIDNIQISPMVIPEPATAVLGLLGGMGLVLRRRR